MIRLAPSVCNKRRGREQQQHNAVGSRGAHAAACATASGAAAGSLDRAATRCAANNTVCAAESLRGRAARQAMCPSMCGHKGARSQQRQQSRRSSHNTDLHQPAHKGALLWRNLHARARGKLLRCGGSQLGKHRWLAGVLRQEGCYAVIASGCLAAGQCSRANQRRHQCVKARVHRWQQGADRASL